MTTVIAATSGDSTVWNDLLSVVLYGVVAGVGIAILFSLALRGMLTASIARRAGSRGAALAWGALGMVAVAGCIGAVLFGLATMLDR
jgi:hypothetical protein